MATYLQTNNVGTIGTSIFIGTLPNSPTIAVGIFPQGGSESESKTLDRLLFQILVRDSTYLAGFTRVETVWSLLHNSWGTLTTRKGRIEADNQPGVHFRDDNEHLVFSLNFTGKFPKQ